MHRATIVLGDMNARIHHTSREEEDVFGPHVFRKPGNLLHANSNQEFVIVSCRSLELVVTNTMFEQGAC